MLGSHGSFVLTLALVATAGCSARPPDTSAAKAHAAGSRAELGTASCARAPGERPRLENLAQQGSTVAVAEYDHALFAYVADRDSRRVHVVDLASGSQTASLALAGVPEQLLVLRDGRVVVALGDSGEIAVLEAAASGRGGLKLLCTRDVPDEPVGLAESADGRSLGVVSASAATLTTLDVESFSVEHISGLARSPRSVLYDDSGRAFVSHNAGAQLSLVDRRADFAVRTIPLGVMAGSLGGEISDLKRLRTGSQAYALVAATVEPDTQEALEAGVGAHGRTIGEAPYPSAASAAKRILVPMVSVDPGEPERQTLNYYGPPPIAGVPKQTPFVAVVDPTAEKSLSTHVLAEGPKPRGGECLLPRAAAFGGRNNRLYVACFGNDELVELDARAVDPMRAVTRRFAVRKGPTGVAIAHGSGKALVFAQFEGALSVVDLPSGAVKTIALEYEPTADVTAFAIGRELFYRSDDKRITAEGLSCASCHPDGGDDGLTWSTPEGGRQTLPLRGRLRGTAPYGWTRRKDTLDGYVASTMARLGGSSLRADELSELTGYIAALELPKRVHGIDESAATRGRAVFTEQGCGTCHPGDAGTDRETHWLGVGSMNPAVDTPSLAGVGRSAPYFHDGRYRSLAELLADPQLGMGEPHRLPADKKADLLAFLESR